MTRTRPTSTAFTMLALGAVLAPLLGASPSAAAPSPPGNTVRFATFNASLNRSAAGQLVAHLSTPENAQAAAVAEIIQRVSPDVLLINEFDFDPSGTALRLFQDNYLSVPHNGDSAVTYPYRFSAPSNTGIASGFDLNNNGVAVPAIGTRGYGDDALGFGEYPGQYGMAVYSRYPIDTEAVRTFQHFLWKDMPGALLPDDPSTSALADWYSQAELAVLPLSSKSHWDLPLRVGKRTVHFLVSHPRRPCSTPPRTATAGVTSTRSGSGATTSPLAPLATSTTTRESAAAWPLAHPS